jgi:hypothetical protein
VGREGFGYVNHLWEDIDAFILTGDTVAFEITQETPYTAANIKEGFVGEVDVG